MSQQVFREHLLSLRIRHDSMPWRSGRTHTNTSEIKSQHKTIQLFKTAWWDKARKATILHLACQPNQKHGCLLLCWGLWGHGKSSMRNAHQRAGVGYAVDMQTYTKAQREILVVAYRPLGLCWIVWGYISQLPISFTASGNLSPSLISASPIAFRLACWTSECLAQIIFPLASMDMAGSSRPSWRNDKWLLAMKRKTK